MVASLNFQGFDFSSPRINQLKVENQVKQCTNFDRNMKNIRYNRYARQGTVVHRKAPRLAGGPQVRPLNDLGAATMQCLPRNCPHFDFVQ
jgi:hypothetical protein